MQYTAWKTAQYTAWNCSGNCLEPNQYTAWKTAQYTAWNLISILTGTAQETVQYTAWNCSGNCSVYCLELLRKLFSILLSILPGQLRKLFSILLSILPGQLRKLLSILPGQLLTCALNSSIFMMATVVQPNTSMGTLKQRLLCADTNDIIQNNGS